MIKYNNSNINDWNFGSDNIAKVYYGVTSGSTSRLPSGYTEVEYIESPRKSEYPYIDTGFMPNQNTRVIADFQYTDTNTHPRCFGCGAWNSVGYIFNAENGISSNGEWKWKFGANGNTWLSTNVVPNFNRHTVEINNGNLYLDNTLIGSTTVTTFQLTDNIGLFGFIQNGSLGGTSAGEYMTGKFYSFKIYDNGTLVRDFVPCKRDNDNVYGMYDIVGGSFYTSPNNYLFSGGSAVTPSSSTTVGNIVYQKVTNGSTPPTPPTPTYETLQDLIDTHTVTYENHNYTLSPTVSGITYFRLYLQNATTASSYSFSDMNSDTSTSTTMFALKANSNVDLYSPVDGYSSIKSAANSSSCQWAYWIDENTIEVDVVAAVGTTIFIKIYQENFPTTFISYRFD